MKTNPIVLFGEAEKGDYQKGFLCNNLTDLVDLFGNPPEESKGLYCATQILLYQYPLLYFRVEEEGFSKEDYLAGAKILSNTPLIKTISAICTPGLGDKEIINALLPLCLAHHPLLITNEGDLFDYLTG